MAPVCAPRAVTHLETTGGPAGSARIRFEAHRVGAADGGGGQTYGNHPPPPAPPWRCPCSTTAVVILRRICFAWNARILEFLAAPWISGEDPRVRLQRELGERRRLPAPPSPPPPPGPPFGETPFPGPPFSGSLLEKKMLPCPATRRADPPVLATRSSAPLSERPAADEDETGGAALIEPAALEIRLGQWR